MNKIEKRETQLIEILRENEKANISTVVDLLNISEATARRLFASLEKNGKIIRIHGGARLAPELEYDYSFRLSASRRSKEKSAIATTAAKIVVSGDKLFLDSGTTVLRLAEALSRKVQSGELKNLSVVTNSLSYIETLSNCCRVILTGGEIRTERRDVCGPAAEKNLSQYNFDKAFLGADAVDLDGGLTTSDERTAGICEIAIKQSDRIYILAGSEKFNKTSFTSYADFADIEEIITDEYLDKKTVKSYKNRGIKIEIAGMEA